jgi:hypothetical protein
MTRPDAVVTVILNAQKHWRLGRNDWRLTLPPPRRRRRAMTARLSTFESPLALRYPRARVRRSASSRLRGEVGRRHPVRTPSSTLSTPSKSRLRFFDIGKRLVASPVGDAPSKRSALFIASRIG